jgi:hypothetical protein
MSVRYSMLLGLVLSSPTAPNAFANVPIVNPLMVLKDSVPAPHDLNCINATVSNLLSDFSGADMPEKKYEVSEETLKQTTKCENNLACLSDNPSNLCRVLRTVGTQLIIVGCNKSRCKYCAYCALFNPAEPPVISEGFCMCTVRKELYERYGI